MEKAAAKQKVQVINKHSVEIRTLCWNLRSHRERSDHRRRRRIYFGKTCGCQNTDCPHYLRMDMQNYCIKWVTSLGRVPLKKLIHLSCNRCTA